VTNNVGANAKRLSTVVLAVALAVVLALAIGAGGVGPKRSASAQTPFPLTISKDAYPMLEVPYSLGTHIDFLITVENNNSPFPSPPVTITDSLPGGVAFVSANASQGDCISVEATTRCELGSIPPGHVAHVNIIVRATAVGTYANVAQDSLGNQAAETYTIGP
jgi:uncharacterized repeat protein (TIGR01451 family)